MDAEPSLDYSALVETYNHTRSITSRLANEAVGFIEKGEMLEAGKRLGLFFDGTLVFESEAEMATLVDFAIRHVYRDGKNAIQQFRRDSDRMLGPDELDLLQRIAASRYRILDIDRIEHAVGMVVTDRLRRESGFLVDRSFSTTAQPGMTLAGHVVACEKFWMTTGATLPMSGRAWLHLERRIVKRFGKLGKTFCKLDPTQEADLAAWCIRACLEHGGATRIIHV